MGVLNRGFGLHAELRRFQSARPPVLLLGGLNLLRPLALAGIPVIVASSERRSSTFASRHCSGRCLLPPIDHRDAFLQVLLEAGERLASAFGRVPLFYGNDDSQSLLQEHRETLCARFRFVLNDPDIARALISKHRFAALAAERGIPVPRSLRWHGDGEASLAACRGPVLVKPKSKITGQDGDAVQKLLGGQAKARIFKNGPALLEDPAAARLKDALVFQEYLTGDDRSLWSFHGFADERGELLAWFIGRKLRTFPRLTGMSSYLQLAHDERLAALGAGIAARLPLKGPFKMDFKEDAASGEFRLLEVNARFNLWHYVAARNGVNLPQIAYDYLVKGRRPARAPAYRTQVRWLCLPLDVQAYRSLASRGELGAARWLGSILAHRKVYDTFAWSDPAPLLWALAGWLASRLQNLPARLGSSLRRWRSTA